MNGKKRERERGGKKKKWDNGSKHIRWKKDGLLNIRKNIHIKKKITFNPYLTLYTHMNCRRVVVLNVKS